MKEERDVFAGLGDPNVPYPSPKHDISVANHYSDDYEMTPFL